MEFKKCLVLLLTWVVGFGNISEASNAASSKNEQKFAENSPKSSIVYHTNPETENGTNEEVRLQTQESRPHGKRQSYSYAATQRPVSYHESYNSPPYYHETNNPPQSYHHEYHSPPSSYNVEYNERPRSHHQSYQSPPQNNQHRSSYNNQESNDHRDGDEQSYDSDNDDHYGYGGDNDSNNDDHGDDDYGHSPSNNYEDTQDEYGRVNLEY